MLLLTILLLVIAWFANLVWWVSQQPRSNHATPFVSAVGLCLGISVLVDHWYSDISFNQATKLVDFADQDKWSSSPFLYHNFRTLYNSEVRAKQTKGQQYGVSIMLVGPTTLWTVEPFVWEELYTSWLVRIYLKVRYLTTPKIKAIAHKERKRQIQDHINQTVQRKLEVDILEEL